MTRMLALAVLSALSPELVAARQHALQKREAPLNFSCTQFFREAQRHARARSHRYPKGISVWTNTKVRALAPGP